MYLDYQIKERIDRIDPYYFQEIDLKKYSTTDNDKFTVRLHKRYQSMEELITGTNSEIYPFLQNTFGIEKEKIMGDVIIFQNKAYVEFVGNAGHTTFVIDRRTKKATFTLIAYVID